MKFLSVISVGGSRTLSDLVNAGLRNLSFPCVCGGRFLHVQDTWRCMHAACSTHTPLTPTDSTLLAPSSRIYELWSLDPSCHFMYQPNSRIQFRGNMSVPASYLWWQRSFLSPPKLHKTECIYRLKNVTSRYYIWYGEKFHYERVNASDLRISGRNFYNFKTIFLVSHLIQ
jgi:hypothetical protein